MRCVVSWICPQDLVPQDHVLKLGALSEESPSYMRGILCQVQPLSQADWKPRPSLYRAY